MKTQLRNILGSYGTKKNKRKDYFEKSQNKPILSEMSSEEQAIGQALSSFVITTIITL